MRAAVRAPTSNASGIASPASRPCRPSHRKNPCRTGRPEIMANYVATVIWTRAPDAPFKDNKYSRAHEWRFDGGAVVKGSSAPSSVKVPLSDPTAVDPEEALVAALSSCHMLFFLSFAAMGGFVIDRYEDEA